MAIFNVDANELIEKAAVELAKLPEMQPPEWSKFVKTGNHKERPPERDDWWHMRAASILRKLYKYGPIGVSKLRSYYGGRKNRGHKPDMFVKGSGNIIRKILQQLEKAEFAKQVEVKGHKGRVISPKGKSLLDKLAAQLAKGKAPKKVEETNEEKEQKPAEKPKKEQKVEAKTEKVIEEKEVKKQETKEEPAGKNE
ncbi:30S ribosomal protein S19e [Candidatus Woesearchaeota archaeon]|nr:30S ribosomal protein S19e [Candidatus Woesearchaeota archaeon]